MCNIDLTPKQRNLREEYNRLRQEFAKYFSLHQEMTMHKEPLLTALFLNKVGQKYYEVFCLQTELARLKRKMELLQAYVNRNEKPNLISVDKTIEKEFEEYAKKIAEEARRLSIANEYLKAPILSKEDSKLLRELYYTIAKLLHPDVNPQVTEFEKVLFLKAQIAYEKGDLEELKQIMASIKLNDKNVLINEESLESSIKNLRQRIANLKLKIEKLEQTFPFIHRDNLQNQEWIDNENEKSEERISQLSQDIEKYKNYITLLEEWQPTS